MRYARDSDVRCRMYNMTRGWRDELLDGEAWYGYGVNLWTPPGVNVGQPIDPYEGQDGSTDPSRWKTGTETTMGLSRTTKNNERFSHLTSRGCLCMCAGHSAVRCRLCVGLHRAHVRTRRWFSHERREEVSSYKCQLDSRFREYTLYSSGVKKHWQFEKSIGFYIWISSSSIWTLFKHFN